MSNDGYTKNPPLKQETADKLILTTRERQCIDEALKGHTLQQIAENLNISVNTVFYYLNGAQVKIANFIRSIIR